MKPPPRWFRERCRHENRVEITAGFVVVADRCNDCGAQFPIPPSRAGGRAAG